MADLYALGQNNSPSRAANQATMRLRSTRDGALYVAEYAEALAMEGRIFVANMGTVTTPITFLATAANRPDAWIRVPSGTAILPLLAVVALEDMAGTNTEIDVRICQNDIGNGTSSAASVGPLALRTDAPVTSSCTARQLATGDTTAETNPVTVYRRSYSLAEGTTDPFPLGIEIARHQMGFPLLVGPATWEIFVAATTTQAAGFVVMTWGEVPSSMIT